jgi:hypothetical protein
MRKLLLATVVAMAAPAAQAGTWWVLDSNSVTCVTGSEAARISRDPAMASPFTLADEMRRLGRLNAPIDFRRAGSQTAYGVKYDGLVSAYFVTRNGCQNFINRARAGGDLP